MTCCQKKGQKELVEWSGAFLSTSFQYDLHLKKYHRTALIVVHSLWQQARGTRQLDKINERGELS